MFLRFDLNRKADCRTSEQRCSKKVHSPATFRRFGSFVLAAVQKVVAIEATSCHYEIRIYMFDPSGPGLLAEQGMKAAPQPIDAKDYAASPTV
jgi:hypothetical protein